MNVFCLSGSLASSIVTRGKHGNHVRGKRQHRWNDGRMLSSHGYVKVRVGREHPLSDPNGYAYEHRLVLAASGIDVPSGSTVHHVNGDKTDNRLENLEVLARGEHNRVHNLDKPRDSKGRFQKSEVVR